MANKKKNGKKRTIDRELLGVMGSRSTLGYYVRRLKSTGAKSFWLGFNFGLNYIPLYLRF